MKDEYVRSYIGRISGIVAGIKSYSGSKDEDEITWNILRNLTRPFRQIGKMIEQVMPCTEKLLERLYLEDWEQQK